MNIDDEHLTRAIDAAIAAKWTGIAGDFDLAGAHWETDGPGPHEIRVDCLINLDAMVRAVIDVERQRGAAIARATRPSGNMVDDAVRDAAEKIAKAIEDG